jgi:hypothetical protein
MLVAMTLANKMARTAWAMKCVVSFPAFVITPTSRKSSVDRLVG